jgi:hypothetical protein
MPLVVVVMLAPTLPVLVPVLTVLVLPTRGLVVAPLLPVPRRFVIVAHRYVEERRRDERRRDHDPGAVVARPDIPSAVDKGVVLLVVPEDVV